MEITGTFWYSLKLDLATASYFMVVPFILLTIQSVWSHRWLNTANSLYTGFLVFCYTLSAVAEMGIYAEWKTKLTYKVLKYLKHPSEIYNSSETFTFFLLLFLLLAVSFLGTLAYVKFFQVRIEKIKRNIWFSLAFLAVVPLILFIGMRGGFQQIPINQSQSYFSRNNILNIAAVNNAFNLYISIFENLQNLDRNPYLFMDPERADRLVRKIYSTPKDTTIHILKTNRPNIVILILESWSADLIESLGGEPGITPDFKSLEKQGILFDQIYASGSRSEQGMASIFGGFPAHPISSITVQPDKFVKLPSLVRELKNEGYHASFYFGGQLIYGNIKSYIIYNGFDKIMEVYDFPSSIPHGKLGIHDGYTLDYMVNDLKNMEQPFISSLFTISTHSPWDQPFEKPLKWGDNEREYINAAYYTDHCLGDFFRKASRESWYRNTLFIIVSDHSHNSYRNWHPESKEYHKIPLLFYGETLKEEFRGTVCHKLGNQHDIASTILAQMGINSKQFTWSKNLFNPYTPDFSYYSTEDGLGWIRSNAYFTYDRGPDFYYWWTDPKIPDSVKLEGKAYFQKVFSEYMND